MTDGVDPPAASRSRPAVLGFLALGAVAGFAAADAAATGLAVLAVAGMPVLFAVPPRARPFVGAALAVVASLVAISTWPPDVLTAVASASVVVAGLVMVWRGAAWPPMARRFDSGTGAQVDLWRELDQGNDPTAEPPQAPPD